MNESSFEHRFCLLMLMLRSKFIKIFQYQGVFEVQGPDCLIGSSYQYLEVIFAISNSLMLCYCINRLIISG